MPEVAGNSFVALTAFANDGLLDGFGDAVGGFVKEDFECGGVLIARIEARDGDAKRIKRGVGASPVGVGGNIHANFGLGPFGLVNGGEALGETEALFAD